MSIERETQVWLVAAAAVLAATILGFCTPSHGHDIYEQLTNGTPCTCGNRNLGNTPLPELCAPVEAIPMTALAAKQKSLKYRIPNWGALHDPDESGYYLPASGEFIPASWAQPSPDDRFHRCTYPLNITWRPDTDPKSRKTGKWIVVPDNSTLDGKPPTRCFWHPLVGF